MFKSALKPSKYGNHEAGSDEHSNSRGSSSKGALKLSGIRKRIGKLRRQDKNKVDISEWKPGDAPAALITQDDIGVDSSRGRQLETGATRRQTRSASPSREGRNVSFDVDSFAPSESVVHAPTPSAPGGYANAYKRPDPPKKYQRANQASSGASAGPSRPARGGGGRQSDGKKIRVRPYRCFPEPVHMTEDEIYKDMMKPSENVVLLKSHFPPSTSKIQSDMHVPEDIRRLYDSPEVDGRIGSIRVEVLGCVGLARQKPYVAVYVVSGDCAFCADVLNNFRSPMWPSVSTRAAVFPVHHAYSKVFIGVFDVRARQGKDNDVFCGRVAVDIAMLRPNTEYDVTFPLRASTFVYDRRKRGVIRMRFSLHWFSERAAVMSYIKSSRWFSASEPLKGLGQPTIPCAEPKTFRNIAVTCHGQDFPGKYTRNAFRATMREFNLYHLNLRFLVKTLILDALLYERPYISLYLLCAFMHCIYSKAIRMVPPYMTGYIILLFLDNYMQFNVNEGSTFGYKPVSIGEVFLALVLNGGTDRPCFTPAEIKKRAKRVGFRGGRSSQTPLETFFALLTGTIDLDEDDANSKRELERRDHREFPFSEMDNYPKFAVQEALAPSTKPPTKGEEVNQNNKRLSIYFVPEEEKEVADEEDEESESEEISESEEDDEREEDAMASANDSQVGDVDVFDMDFDKEDDDDMRQAGALFDSGTRIKRARVHLGPQQSTDYSPLAKIPPQQTLQKVERQMHKLSRGIALERVITIPGARKYGPEEPDANAAKKKGGKAAKEALAAKAHYDEFDKVLGLQSKTANPVLRITSSFLGPMMRLIRIFLFAVRIAFNVSTWKDPYLSFWVLTFLVLLTFVLLIFPWRPFLFVSSFLCLGPQNIFVRKYLERQAAEKAEDMRLEAEMKKAAEAESNLAAAGSRDENDAVEKKKKGWTALLSRLRRGEEDGGMPERERDESDLPDLDLVGETLEQRPAFSTEHNARSGKKLQPREVAVPYSKLKKDRFYDWPPDPTVSRATPTDIYELLRNPSEPIPEPIPQTSGQPGEEVVETLRKRYQAEQNQFVLDGVGDHQMSPW